MITTEVLVMAVSAVVTVTEVTGDHGGKGGDSNMRHSKVGENVCRFGVNRDQDSNRSSTTYSLPDLSQLTSSILKFLIRKMEVFPSWCCWEKKKTC